MQPEVRMLPTKSLTPCEVNPRFKVGDVTELADSIAALGVLVPLLVQPRGKGYLVVAGHRRLAACKQLGVEEVPAIIREMTELERMEMMLVENQQRVPLSPIEEGIAYARILKQHSVSQKELAKHVGKSEWYVSVRLHILKLPKHVIDAIHAGEIGPSHALGYTTTGVRRKPVGKSIRRDDLCKLARHAKHDPDACELQRLAEGAA